MEKCPLCGRNMDDPEKCSICGYEPEAHLYDDIRDEATKDPMKSSGRTKEALLKRNKITLSYIQNIDVVSSPKEEVDSIITEALQLLSIPVHIRVGRDLTINDTEKKLILAIGDKVDEMDDKRDMTSASTETYVRLANGEYAIGEVERSLAHLDKAILKDPRDSEGYYNKARVLFYKHDYQASLRLLQKAHKLHPDNDSIIYFKELVEQVTER